MKTVKPISVAPKVCIEIAKNFAMKVPAISRLRTKLGRTAGAPNKDKLDRYAYNLVEKIQQHCGSLEGKTILEVGPGDHLTTGLAMLALGAKSYSVLDRFPGDYHGKTSVEWYQTLKRHWKYSRWPEDLDVNNWLDSDRVKIHNVSAEEFVPADKYDIVCSNVVGEHISDIRGFAKLNRDCIGKDGIGIHCIDFGGHQWDRYGDPFLFLRFPDFIWNLMGSARGEPNRVRFAPYVRYFKDAGLDVEAVDIKHFDFDGSDKWVADRMDESFSVHEATIMLRLNR